MNSQLFSFFLVCSHVRIAATSRPSRQSFASSNFLICSPVGIKPFLIASLSAPSTISRSLSVQRRRVGPDRETSTTPLQDALSAMAADFGVPSSSLLLSLVLDSGPFDRSIARNRSLSDFEQLRFFHYVVLNVRLAINLIMDFVGVAEKVDHFRNIIFTQI